VTRSRKSEIRGQQNAVDSMNKKILLLALCSLLLAPGFAAQAQQPKKVYRIGYLSSNDAADESARAEAIRLALRGLAT
jgi:hypothetical protein